jgi:hypothetical protein
VFAGHDIKINPGEGVNIGLFSEVIDFFEAPDGDDGISVHGRMMNREDARPAQEKSR